jgi:Lipopolysaccharide-assembly
MINYTYRLIWFLLLGMSIIVVACYSFKGISIDPNIKTFAVRTFETTAPNAPPTLAIDFTERLKDKIRAETPLALNNETPDCEFSGKVTSFDVIPLAPKPGESVAKNQLKIGIRVNYIINKEGIANDYPEAGKDFSFFAEFPSENDLSAVQDQLITEINRQLLEDIFNAAFNNW